VETDRKVSVIMREVRVSDVTMRRAANSRELSLSFKEKLEMAKLLDHLGVSAIEVGGIENPKADSLLIKQSRDHEVSDEDIIRRIGLPCFVKPASGGSSFGTTKVKTPEALRPAIDLALKEGEDVMVEAFMKGTEVTCGCYKTRTKSVVFPVTEVVTENEFFDYDAKYNGQVQEITPARISDSLTQRIQTLTGMLYDILGCHGIIRIDYIITEGNKINMLEINTTPGMTPTSFIPQQVRAAGLEIRDVLTDIIEDTLNA
jgi:D-alanine-D-alanine ligase